MNWSVGADVLNYKLSFDSTHLTSDGTIGTWFDTKVNVTIMTFMLLFF